MVSVKPKSQEISTAMCYKNKLLVSYTEEPSLHLFSLSALPYAHLSTLSTKGPVLSFDWGFKRDLVLVSGPAEVMILKISEKTNTIQQVQVFPFSASLGVFSYQNDFILLGSPSGEVLYVNLETGSKAFSYYHKASVTGVDINYEDDLIVSSSLDCTCLLHKASEKKKLRTLEFAEHNHTKNLPFMGCRFSKRGDVLFTVSCDEYSYLTQWDTKELSPICTYRLHAAPVKTFNMSLDGFFLGIGTVDGWVKILNTRTMDFERKTEEFNSSVNAFTFTYDSRHVVVAAGSQFKNMFNTRGEGFFSKASKIWVISIFLLWFYLYFS